MATEGDKSDEKFKYSITDPTSPFYLHPSSSPGSVLTHIKLKGENYSSWEQAVLLALRSQNKIGFIDGSIKKPEKADPTFMAWEIVNSMLCSWIANSLEDPIRITISRLTNVKTLWDCLKSRYSVKNGPKVYKVWSDLTITKQAGVSIMSYYTQFLGMWEELATLSPLENCSCENGSPILAWFNNLKVYQFLMGLDESYNTLRTQIINMEPLPDLDRVYSMVTQEESHRSVVQTRETGPAMGFAAQVQPLPPNTQSSRPFCTYCQRQGHVFERCWTRLGINPTQNRDK